ncbi:MAG: dihydroorotate dehydrogenase-like protein [Capsulimonadaceae bacterium]|nr:dihydroorotate dehydrogenase-like protein [Capsulimonadaceae bacterium]
MNLETTYLGLKLKNPIVAAASPLSASVDGVKRLEDAGASAVVLPSLFEEQIQAESQELDYYLSYGTESNAEALDFFPEAAEYRVGPTDYLNLIRGAKESVEIPVIASMNGVSRGGWMRYAKLMEQAGADALELNVYFVATDPTLSGAEVEMMYQESVRAVRESVSIPLSVKIGPFFSSLPYVARSLSKAGADGLVLFNRFYQPDLDLDKLEVIPNLQLSTPSDLRLPLRWIAILYGRLAVDLALSGGVHSHLDVLKGLMSGASVTQIASELLANGPGRIGEILTSLNAWLDEFEYESIIQLRGSMSQRNVAETAAYERANYMKVLNSYKL